MRRFSYNTTYFWGFLVLLLLIALVLFELSALGHSPLATRLPMLYIGLILLLTLVAIGVMRIIKAFEKGEDGEMAVGKILANLPSAYYSLHDFVEGKKGNIDYVVIGPTGVWTIEVKNTGKGGEITFENGLLCRNGYPLAGHDLKQAYAEAQELQNFIRVSPLGLYLPVNPVLVFANPKVKMRFGFHGVNGVQVIGIRWLIKLLQETNTGTRLTHEQCITIRDEVKKYTSII